MAFSAVRPAASFVVPASIRRAAQRTAAPSLGLGYDRIHSAWSGSARVSRRHKTSCFDRSLPKCHLTIQDTSLGSGEAALLLDGLDVYSVPAEDDSHPLSVYGFDTTEPSTDDNVLLLLHGRTWSSVPVYHLLGGPQNNEKGYESRSLMEALHDQGIKTYAMDFRGFGGTPHDARGFVEPYQCVQDVESVLQWISDRHDLPKDRMPHLLGWSQGALVAQLVAQKTKPLLSKLILYGSIYDPLIRYPREPLYVSRKADDEVVPQASNTFDSAIEDFTIEGTIPPEPARIFAEHALLSDPIKAVWKQLHQFNNCDPARIHVPTLVVAGDQDPYAPLHVQQELFLNLGRGSDRTWSILADADHAVHLLEGRDRFTDVVASFVLNGKRSEQKRIETL